MIKNKSKKRIVALIIVISLLVNDIYASGTISYAANKDTITYTTEDLAESTTESLENVTDEDITAENATEENITEESTTDDTTSLESTTEETTSQESTTEESTTEENTTEESSTEELIPQEAEYESENINETKEDLIVDKDLKLTEDIVVNNFEINHSSDLDLNGHTLTIEGDCDITSGTVYFNAGENICNGNFTISTNSKLNMKTVNDRLFVVGDFVDNSQSKYLAGIIDIKGNFTVNNKFMAQESHKVILSGYQKQIISMGDGAYFATLEINNFSADGVYVSYAFQYDKLIDNGCVINYENINGYRGAKLEEDIEIDGLYYLISNTLDLNGHTMTINGDLIQGGGIIDINGGKLIVNGNYKVQTIVEEIDEDTNEHIIKYDKSSGYLIMDGDEDYLFINGDYINW